MLLCVVEQCAWLPPWVKLHTQLCCYCYAQRSIYRVQCALDHSKKDPLNIPSAQNESTRKRPASSAKQHTMIIINYLVITAIIVGRIEINNLPKKEDKFARLKILFFYCYFNCLVSNDWRTNCFFLYSWLEVLINLLMLKWVTHLFISPEKCQGSVHHGECHGNSSWCKKKRWNGPLFKSYFLSRNLTVLGCPASVFKELNTTWVFLIG